MFSSFAAYLVLTQRATHRFLFLSQSVSGGLALGLGPQARG